MTAFYTPCIYVKALDEMCSPSSSNRWSELVSSFPIFSHNMGLSLMLLLYLPSSGGPGSIQSGLSKSG